MGFRDVEGGANGAFPGFQDEEQMKLLFLFNIKYQTDIDINR